MQLNVTTDYAIRIVLYLATVGDIVSSQEISKDMGIPKNYILKITKRLANADMVEIHKGAKGGISIKKAAADISLFSIIQIMESTMKLNRCLEGDKHCSRCATENCPVRSFYCVLQEELEMKLSSLSIQDLLNKSLAN